MRLSLNFLFLNLVAVALWAVASGHCLFFLSITGDATKPCVIRSSTHCGKFEFLRPGVQTVSSVQPTDTGNIVLTLEGEPGSFSVSSAQLTERFLLVRKWNSDDIIRLSNGDMLLDRACSHLGLHPWILWIVGFFEAFALLLAYLIGRLTSNDRKATLLEIFGVAFSAILSLCVLLPLQTFIGNSECFDFSMCDLIVSILPMAGFAFLILFVFLCVGVRLSGCLWLSVTAAVVVYEYLETGVLSIGNASLDGDIFAYKNLSRGLFDLFVFITILVSAVAMRNRRIFSLAAIAATVLFAASVFDARPQTTLSFESDIVDGPTDNATVIRSAVFSDKRNVMLLFLDSITTPYVQDVLEQSEDIRLALDGFCFCTNNVGMYANTAESVPAVMTGRYRDKGEKVSFSKIFSSGLIIEPYVAQQAKIMFAPGCISYGYTTEKDAATNCLTCVASSSHKPPLYRRMSDLQQWNVYEIVRFRMTPYIAKYYAYGLALYGWGQFDGFSEESWTFPIIAEARMDAECPLTLHSYHTIGSHAPFGVDRNGLPNPLLRAGYFSRMEKTWYSLGQAVKMLKRLQERGIYDKTFMMIVADHGGGALVPDGRQSPTAAPSKAFPFMMFKPIATRGPISFAGTPTSHSRIASVIKELATRDLSMDETLGMLACSNRVFRMSQGGGSYEYRFGSDCLGGFEKLRFDDGGHSTRQLEIGREYRLGVAGSQVPIEIVNQGEEGMVYEGCRLYTPPQLISVETGIENAEFVPSMSEYMYWGASSTSSNACRWKLKDEISGNVAETSLPDRHSAVKKLELAVKSDDRGVIKILSINTEMHAFDSFKLLRRK